MAKAMFFFLSKRFNETKNDPFSNLLSYLARGGAPSNFLKSIAG